MQARGGDLMPGTIPAIGLLIVRSDPGVGTFDFDRQKPGINSEAVVALQLCPPLQFGPLTYQPIEWGFISSNQSAL